MNYGNKFNQGGKTAKKFSKDQRQWIKDNPNKILLYYLSEDHYVGITSCKQFFIRMHQHRTAGKYTENVEVIASYDKRVFAHLDETKLHCIGYNGFRNLTRV